MEGILYKWTNYFSFWKQRYFVLRGNILYYYIKKGDRPRGRIHLGVSHVNESPEEDTKFEIDTGLAVIYLKTETKEEKDEWIVALRKAKTLKDDSKVEKSKAIHMDDYYTNRNSINNDDKLVRKISNIKFTFDKIRDETQSIAKYVSDEDVMEEYNVLFVNLGHVI